MVCKELKGTFRNEECEYCKHYHCEQRQRRVRYRIAEDERSPPTALHGSPIAYERYQRGIEFPIRNRGWYLQMNFCKFSR